MKDLAVEMHEEGRRAEVTAIGGFPAHMMPDSWSIETCLGESSLLTYMNPRGKSRAALGAQAIDKGHMWAGHWINLSITFWEHQRAEIALARDKRFWISWSERSDYVFTATGSINEWTRYLAHHDDPSFSRFARAAMIDARDALIELDPYFRRVFS